MAMSESWMKALAIAGGLLSAVIACGDDERIDPVGAGGGGAGGTPIGGQGGAAGGAGGGGGEGPGCTEPCPDGRVCVDGDACIFPLDPGGALTDVDAALATWDAIWTFYDTEYGAFPAKDVDWDAVRSDTSAAIAGAATVFEADWRVVQGVNEIQDGHTGAVSQPICSVDPGFSSSTSNIGACLAAIDGHALVYKAEPASGWGLGDEVVAFDGRTVEEAKRDLVHQPRCFSAVSTDAHRERTIVDGLMFRAPTDQLVTVIRAGQTSPEDVAIQTIPTSGGLKCDGRIGLEGVTEHAFGIESAVLPSNVLYVHLPAFSGTDAAGNFVSEPVIDELRPLFEDAMTRAGLIFDIRSNPGGFPAIYMAIASWVFDEPTALFQCQAKAGPGHDDHALPWTMTSAPDPSLHYPGKMALLVNARTFSAGDFTFGWRSITGRAMTFGEPSGGGFGNGMGEPYDANWHLAYNDILCSDFEGAPLEGHPPPVDVPVGYSVEDIALGVDTVIAAAESWILAG
jgi:C-terminal processing protease CtpA/Prc